MKDEELWLIWRKMKSDDNKDRRRYRIGVLIKKSTGGYLFRYDLSHDYEAAKKAGFSYYPGFINPDASHVYKSDELFPGVALRLPKKDKDDYLDYLNRYGLKYTDDEFEILKATRGRQITDNYEFVPAFDKTEIEFEVAGVSHQDNEKIKKYIKDGYLQEGTKIVLERDVDNIYDKYAMRVMIPISHEWVQIGYVPRYYSEELASFLDKGIEYSAIVTKVDPGARIVDEKISTKVRLIFK